MIYLDRSYIDGWSAEDYEKWLRGFAIAPWVRHRPGGVQRVLDQTAVDCLEMGDPLLGCALAWLGTCRAAGLLEAVIQRMIIDLHAAGRVSFEAPPRCRVCGCAEDESGHPIDRMGRPGRWVERNLCSDCVGAAMPLFPTLNRDDVANGALRSGGTGERPGTGGGGPDVAGH